MKSERLADLSAWTGGDSDSERLEARDRVRLELQC